MRWFSSPVPGGEVQQKVTVSLSLDNERHWYGVLAMDIPVSSMKRFLEDAVEKDSEGEYQLYDYQLRLLATSRPEKRQVNTFDDLELALLANDIEHDTHGGIRMGSRYISWERLDHFDGVLLRVHTLREGVQGAFGSISIALGLLWALFTMMLLIS